MQLFYLACQKRILVWLGGWGSDADERSCGATMVVSSVILCALGLAMGFFKSFGHPFTMDIDHLLPTASMKRSASVPALYPRDQALGLTGTAAGFFPIVSRFQIGTTEFFTSAGKEQKCGSLDWNSFIAIQQAPIARSSTAVSALRPLSLCLGPWS